VGGRVQSGHVYSEDHHRGAEHRHGNHEPPDQWFQMVAFDRLFRAEPLSASASAR
jgi:hypothetical protein